MDFVANEFDPRTGTIHLRALVSEAKELFLPGLFVRVRMPVGQQKALLLPEGMQVDPGHSNVLVVYQNVVESRTVKLERIDEGVRDVSHPNFGLRPRDWVIIEAGNDLKPGMTVQPERVRNPASQTNK